MLKKDCMYFSFPQKCLLLEHQLIFSLLQSSRNFGDPPKKKHKIKKQVSTCYSTANKPPKIILFYRLISDFDSPCLLNFSILSPDDILATLRTPSAVLFYCRSRNHTLFSSPVLFTLFSGPNHPLSPH